MFLRKTAQFPDISTVAPSTDFFEISVFLKHMHQEFIYHRNFGWKLKSNLLPLLVQCGGAISVHVEYAGHVSYFMFLPITQERDGRCVRWMAYIN